MRTASLLTVSQHALRRGYVCPGGVCLEGVCQGGICLGYLPPTHYHTGGLCSGVSVGGVSLTENPLDRDPLDRDAPWTETPGQRPSWTETPLDRDPPGQRLQHRDPTHRDPLDKDWMETILDVEPQTETETLPPWTDRRLWKHNLRLRTAIRRLRCIFN